MMEESWKKFLGTLITKDIHYFVKPEWYYQIATTLYIDLLYVDTPRDNAFP